MKYRLRALAGVILLGLLAVVESPALITNTIVYENFESYSTTADMQLKWGSTGLGVLVATNGNPGNSAYHPGGAVNSWIGSTFSLAPSDSQTMILLRADIFDSAAGSAQRNTVGLRQAAGGATPLFEMGHYNSWSSQYGVRVVNSYNGANWVPFGGVTRTAGWNRYEALFTSTEITVTLDIGADGTVDSTLTFAGTPSANPYGDLRFGGPSGVASAAPAWFDNIELYSIIPEPSTVALSLLSLLAMGMANRRKSRRA